MKVEIYVKPECKNNKKQIEMLKEKGHDVTVKNIFEEEWTAEKLTPFFQNLSFDKWHNPYAPRIKSGDVDPAGLTHENIFEEMIGDNYLIRRPLLKAANRYDCGFDSELATLGTPNIGITGRYTRVICLLLRYLRLFK